MRTAQHAASTQSPGPALTRPSRPHHVNVNMLDHSTIHQKLKSDSTLSLPSVDPWNMNTDEDVKVKPLSAKQSQGNDRHPHPGWYKRAMMHRAYENCPNEKHCGLAWRWYFQQTDEKPIGQLSTADSPVGPPKIIRINQDWKCPLPPGSLTKEVTMVSVVLCISLSGSSTEEALESLRFTFKHGKLEVADIIIRDDELRGIPKQHAARLRLYDQIPFHMESEVEVSINIKGAASAGTYNLHYIEMGYCNQATNDLLLYGESKPHLSLQVGCSVVESINKTITVHSHCVSRSGSYAATLCFHAGHAIIEVWDIAVSGEASSQGTPQQLSVPSARGSVPAVSVPERENTELCISCSGSSLTFFTDGSAEPSISFQLLTWTPSGTCNDKDTDPKTLSSRRPCSSLCGFVGFGAFVAASDDIHENKCEKFIACDGVSVSVYSTTDDWSLLTTIALGLCRNLEAASNVITSARGRYFAWTGDKGVVSVWDMETAKHFIHIPLTDEIAKGSPVKFSRSGSLMAICSGKKGQVAVHQLPSGVKMGRYTHRVEKYASYGVFFGDDQLIVPAYDRPYARTIVCTRTMKSIRTFSVNKGYNLKAHQLNRMVFARKNGSTVGYIKSTIEGTRPSHTSRSQDQELEEVKAVMITLKDKKTFESSTGIVYGLSLQGNTIMVEVSYMGVADSAPFRIPLDIEEPFSVFVVFLPQPRRLLVITDYLYIWDLPQSSSDLAQSSWDLTDSSWDPPPSSKPNGLVLVQVWALLTSSITGYQLAIKAWTLDEGRRFFLTLLPSTQDSSERSGEEPPLILEYPTSELENFPISKQDRIVQGIKGAVKIYRAKTSSFEEQNNAVIQYLKTLVRPSSTNPTSCIVTLCHLWNSDESSQFEAILNALLSMMSYIFPWIPNSTFKKSSDPVAILMEKAETHPEALEAASKVIDYCVHAACCTRNLTFMAPVYGSMREVMAISPDVVLGSLKKGVIHIQNKRHRSFIVNNHIIAHPPRFRLRFWEPVSQPLHECGNPIMQLYVSPEDSPMTSKFSREVFVASFDALWLRNDITTDYNNKPGAVARTIPASNTVTTAGSINWWRVLTCIMNVKLQSRSRMHVECYVFNSKFFDNPAIAALVAYKWNTIGFSYWLLRFVCQCCYYILVLTAAILQIYSSERAFLIGVFISIITLAAVFIWLEVVQACQDWRKYHRSHYNALDILAFTLPLGASIDQLLSLTRTEPSGNVRPLSFSVLVVFLHMLFELRINKSVCKHVTIIQHILSEIRIFFFIFAAGIAAFSIGLMHLLHGCPLQGCKHDPAPTFSRNFFSALSSTYFFMGGRYDSVGDKLDSEDWAFHLMMVSFFFFTVILMLNVLIALINVAFTKGDDVWRLTWVESRLRYIEAAENMSYHIPGFREAYNWFPSEIYYTMTRDQWREYEWRKREDEDVW